eukprot:m.113631 g.113631  ORF g.113631 m.113631 type:complete len:561 (+) comp17092_c0_seq1:281-1963(+)
MDHAIKPQVFLYDVYDGLLDRIFKLVCDNAQSESCVASSGLSGLDPIYLYHEIATCIHTTAVTAGIEEPEHCSKRRMIVELSLFLKSGMQNVDTKFETMMHSFRNALPSSWDVGEESRFFELLTEFRLHAILKTMKRPEGPVVATPIPETANATQIRGETNETLLRMIKVVCGAENNRNKQQRKKFYDEHDYDGFSSDMLDFLKPVMRNLPEPRLNAASKYSREMILWHSQQSKSQFLKAGTEDILEDEFTGVRFSRCAMAALVREGDIGHDVWLDVSQPRKRRAAAELPHHPAAQRLRSHERQSLDAVTAGVVSPVEKDATSSTAKGATARDARLETDSAVLDPKSESCRDTQTSAVSSPVQTHQSSRVDAHVNDSHEQSRDASVVAHRSAASSAAAQVGSKLLASLGQIKDISDPLLEYQVEPEALPKHNTAPSKKKSLLQELANAATEKVRADSMESDVSDWNSSPVDARRGLSAVASAPSPLARSRKGQNQTGKARRVRRPWTEEQVDALKQGVKEFGVGQWRQIAERYFDKSTIKSGRDLKDKWRNLKLAKKTED